MCGIRVKTWGKSPRIALVTVQWGKPQALKGQINRGYSALAEYKGGPSDSRRVGRLRQGVTIVPDK